MGNAVRPVYMLAGREETMNVWGIRQRVRREALGWSRRQMLEEMESNDVEGQPTRGGERSRLLRDRGHGGSYS